MVTDPALAPDASAAPVMIAAPGSGHGKTTVATGLMGALRAEGLEVAGFKVGPDYIDPGYHALATGRSGPQPRPAPVPARSRWCRCCCTARPIPTPPTSPSIEGVMGLFDGQIGGDGFASTAHVAGLIGAPVMLVVDISQVSRTAAAIVHGLHTFDPAVRLGGVILNKAGSARHADEIVRRDGGDRHRRCSACCPGTPASRRRPATSGWCRPPSASEAAAGRGPAGRAGRRARRPDRRCWPSPTRHRPWPPSAWDAARRRPTRRRRPGRWSPWPAGRAFTFRYAETEELLRAAGCEPVDLRPADRHRAAARARPGSTSAAASPRCTPPSWPPTRRCAPRSAAAVAGRAAHRRRVRRPAVPVPGGRRRARWSARSTPRRG